MTCKHCKGKVHQGHIEHFCPMKPLEINTTHKCVEGIGTNGVCPELLNDRYGIGLREKEMTTEDLFQKWHASHNPKFDIDDFIDTANKQRATALIKFWTICGYVLLGVVILLIIKFAKQ